jgi:hypothetical protein
LLKKTRIYEFAMQSYKYDVRASDPSQVALGRCGRKMRVSAGLLITYFPQPLANGECPWTMAVAVDESSP